MFKYVFNIQKGINIPIFITILKRKYRKNNSQSLKVCSIIYYILGLFGIHMLNILVYILSNDYYIVEPGISDNEKWFCKTRNDYIANTC